MNDDDIEKMLTDEILPSSGFEMSVMEAVHQEIVTPPLEFPWGRALPGVAALLAAFGIAIWAWIAALKNPAQNIPVEEQFHEVFSVVMGSAVQWAVVAIVVTIASVFLSLHVTRARY
jgi:hypothetical protein